MSCLGCGLRSPLPEDVIVRAWIGLIGFLAVGCSAAPQGGDLEGAVGRAESATTSQLTELGHYLVSDGVLTESEAVRLLPLGGELGWSAFQTPGIAGSDSLIKVIVVGPEGSFAQDSAGTARCSVDAWASSSDRPSTARDWHGQAVLVFDLGSYPANTTLACAYRTVVDGSQLWLNNQGRNYVARTRLETPLQWVGGLRLDQDGLPRVIDVDAAYPKHPLTVEVSTYPQTPGTEVTLHYTTDSFATIRRVRAAYGSIDAGPQGNDTLWKAVIPASELQPGQKVVYWVDAGNSHGTLWDSRNGANYSVNVAAEAPKVSWAEAGTFVYQPKYGPWSYRSGVANPLTFTMGTWLPPSAPPHPTIQLYIAGITDRQDARNAAGNFVKVEVWSPFFSGSPDGEWKGHALQLREAQGNDWRFSWQVHNSGCSCAPPPGADSLVEHGVYPYKFRVSTDGGETWSWVGTGKAPDGGDDLRIGWFIDHHPSTSVELSGAVKQPWGVTYDFGSVAKGKTLVRKTQMVNTSPVPISIASRYGEPFITGDEGGYFEAAIDGCADWSSCEITLDPGEGAGVSLSFSPNASGAAQASLQFNVTATYPGAPSATEGAIIRLSGTAN